MSHEDLYALTLDEYLRRASSKSPTPGGGSVSAVTATGAAAMVSMVANLTIGKKGYEACQDLAKLVQADAVRQIDALKAATAADMAAFDAFMTVWRMPAATPAEKIAKEAAMERAAADACRPPLEIGECCVTILRLARELAPVGNKSAISDVGVAVYIAQAALRSALLSVDINLPLIRDARVVAELVTRRARLVAEAEDLGVVALGTVKGRLG